MLISLTTVFTAVIKQTVKVQLIGRTPKRHFQHSVVNLASDDIGKRRGAFTHFEVAFNMFALLSSLGYLDTLVDNIRKGGVQQRSRFCTTKVILHYSELSSSPLVIPPMYQQHFQRNISGVIQDAFLCLSELVGGSEDCS